MRLEEYEKDLSKTLKTQLSGKYRTLTERTAHIEWLSKNLTLVGTGKYIGEGFDKPRLDKLFLAMPISWKGTLQQYAGKVLFSGFKPSLEQMLECFILI